MVLTLKYLAQTPLRLQIDAVESAKGGYVNLSYDILTLTNSTKSMPLFVQYENLNPEV